MLSFLRRLSSRPPAPGRRPLRLEQLEDRTVPSAAGLLPSKIGVVRPTASGVAQFSLDNVGNGQFGPGDSVFSFGLNSDTFLVGDWNGDGSDKIGVVRPGANGSKVWSLDGNGDGVFNSGDPVYTFGQAADFPIVGDWTGSGSAKIGVVHANADGTVTVTLDADGSGGLSAADPSFNFGRAGDKFIVGDWNSDGKSKVGVVRNDGQGGATVILDMNDPGAANNPANVTSFRFGYFSDTFVVGDWNGDGKTKVGVVRPTATGVAIWALDGNGNNAFDAADQVFYFGLNTDTVVVGKWKTPASAAPTLAALVPTGASAPATPATHTGLVSTLQGLTSADLQPAIQAAIASWAAAGLNQVGLDHLKQATVSIAPLRTTWMAQTGGYAITLDPAAQGLGWFIDPTPNSNASFPNATATGLQASAGSPAEKGVDLVSVLAHEMGHVLGLPDQTTQVNDVVYQAIGVGVRRLPAARNVAMIPAIVTTAGGMA